MGGIYLLRNKLKNTEQKGRKSDVQCLITFTLSKYTYASLSKDMDMYLFFHTQMVTAEKLPITFFLFRR